MILHEVKKSEILNIIFYTCIRSQIRLDVTLYDFINVYFICILNFFAKGLN